MPCETNTKPEYARSALAAFDAGRDASLNWAKPAYQARSANALLTIAKIHHGEHIDLANLSADPRTWEQAFADPFVHARMKIMPGRTGTQTLSMARSLLKTYCKSIEPPRPKLPRDNDDPYSDFLNKASSPDICSAERLGPKAQALIPLRQVFDVARNEGRSIPDLDRSWFLTKISENPDCGGLSPRTYKNAAVILDRLRKNSALGRFLSADKIGQIVLPSGSRISIELPPQWEPDSDPGYQKYECTEGNKGMLREVGHNLAKSTVDHHRQGRSWYWQTLRAANYVAPEDFGDVRKLLDPGLFEDAVLLEIRGQNPWSPLAASTLLGYMYSVELWLRSYDEMFSGHALRIKKRHAFFKTCNRLSEKNERICLGFLSDNTWQSRYFSMPAHGYRDAKLRLAWFDKQSSIEKDRTLRLCVGATVAAILTATPLRRHSLLSIDFKNNLSFRDGPQGRMMHINLDPNQVKGSKKRIERVIHPRPEHNVAEIVEWFREEATPLLLQSRLKTSDPRALFLGMSAPRISKAWSDIAGQAGVELGMHQARHIMATWLLHKRPDALEYVAACLGITPETCRRHYAFVHEVGLARRCDEMLIDLLKDL